MKSQGSLADRVKLRGVVAMRHLHRRVIEVKSVDTFRRRRVATSPPPRLEPAALHYKGLSWLPTELLVPDALPREANLPLGYKIPYFLLGKVGWRLYGSRPIDNQLPWDPESNWNQAFPDGAAEWGDPSEDDAFTRLRLQGPNPFMLKLVEPDPAERDPLDEHVFDLDFSALFDGVFPPVVARFALRDGALQPSWIRIGDESVRPDPGDSENPEWTDAKRVVNALDARYATFVRHLFDTHLLVGAAYSVAAYSLPVHHPFRPFMDFFTYGTLQVNDMAYRSLLGPDSYFIRSNFVSPDDARRIFQNAADLFDFDEWILHNDLRKRRIDLIPDHPYVADATTAWPAIDRIVRRHLAELDYDTDDVLTSDPDMAAWYAVLRHMLPDGSMPPMNTIDDLVDLLTALIYNNVIHEVCGNLSPILDSRDPDDKRAINIDHLRAMVDPDQPAPTPLAADIFLIDQASFVSRFNVAGNNLMKINAAAYVDDPKLLAAIEELQDTLGELDRELAARNRARPIPFEMMRPYKWEASISF